MDNYRAGGRTPSKGCAGSVRMNFPFGLNVMDLTPEIGQEELYEMFSYFGPCTVYRPSKIPYGWVGFAHMEDSLKAFHIMSSPGSPLPMVSLDPFDENDRESPHHMSNRHIMGAKHYQDRYPVPYERRHFMREDYADYFNDDPFREPLYPPFPVKSPRGPRHSYGDARHGRPSHGSEVARQHGAESKVGPCVECKQMTVRFCTMCSIPCCSERCQKLAWNTPKHVCRIPPVSFYDGNEPLPSDIDDAIEKLRLLKASRRESFPDRQGPRPTPGEHERSPQSCDNQGMNDSVEKRSLTKNEGGGVVPNVSRQESSSSISSQNGELRDCGSRHDRRPPARYSNDSRSDRRRSDSFGDDGQDGFSRGASRGDQRHSDRGDQRHSDRGDQRHSDRGDQRQSDRGDQRHFDRGDRRNSHAGDRRDRSYTDRRSSQMNSSGIQRNTEYTEEIGEDRQPANRPDSFDYRRPCGHIDYRSDRPRRPHQTNDTNVGSGGTSSANCNGTPAAAVAAAAVAAAAVADDVPSVRSIPAKCVEVIRASGAESNEGSPQVQAASDDVKAPEPPRPQEPRTQSCPAEEGICVALGCDDVVTINIASATDNLYVSPSLSASTGFLEMTAQLMDYCKTAPALGREPRDKEVFACLFEDDDTYYRAVVDEVRPGNEYNVLFCDYGNTQVCKADVMKAIPANLKVCPRNAVQVKLRNVETVPVYGKIAEFINKLTDNCVELVVKFDGDLENGVELFLPSGESVNEKVQRLIGKSPAPSLSANGSGAASSSSATSGAAALPKSSTGAASSSSSAAAGGTAAGGTTAGGTTAGGTTAGGTTAGGTTAGGTAAGGTAASGTAASGNTDYDVGIIQAIQLATDKPFSLVVFDIVDEFYIAACCADADNLQFYQTDLMNQIAEACAKDTNPMYPKLEQMCLGKYDDDGQMYRAYTLDVFPDGKRKLFFVDYGNVSIVDPKDIRKITPTLMAPLALSTTCKIAGVEETPENWAKVKELLLPPEEPIKVFKNVTAQYVDAFAEVTIPSILNALR